MEPESVTTETTTELAIDTQAGLETFAEYIDTLRTEIEGLQAEYYDLHQSVADAFYEAGEVYRSLRELVMYALEEIHSTEHVSQTIVEALQNAYDRLLVCRDVLTQALEVPTALAHTGAEVPVSTDASDTKTIEVGAVASPFFAVASPVSASASSEAAHIRKSRSEQRPPRDNLFTKKIPDTIKPTLLTKEILEHPRYSIVIDAQFGGVAACEKALRFEIESRERPSKLDTVLGITYKSPFYSFLKDLTVQEIAELVEESRAEMLDRTAALQVEYRVYHEWMKLVSFLHELVRPHPRMTFSELYIRAELEVAWQEFNAVR